MKRMPCLPVAPLYPLHLVPVVARTSCQVLAMSPCYVLGLGYFFIKFAIILKNALSLQLFKKKMQVKL